MWGDWGDVKKGYAGSARMSIFIIAEICRGGVYCLWRNLVGWRAMTDEEGFQSHLDAYPDDHVCRLAFADWLQDRGDERAEGYRALGLLQVYPNEFGDWLDSGKRFYCYHNGTVRGSGVPLQDWHVLPQDWLDLTQDEEYRMMDRKFYHPTEGTALSSCIAESRRFLEDAAALAFLKLPVARRAELLAQPVLV